MVAFRALLFCTPFALAQASMIQIQAFDHNETKLVRTHYRLEGHAPRKHADHHHAGHLRGMTRATFSKSTQHRKKAVPVTRVINATNVLNLGNGGWIKSTDQSFYDEQSGWLMKARYNCQGDTRGPGPASRWKYVRDKNDPEETWGKIIEEAGGHHKIAQAAMRRSDSCGTQRKTSILLMGNSLLRQVFEAMANRFRDQLTAGQMNSKSPEMDLSQLEKSKKVSIKDFEFFSINNTYHPHCHGYNITKYYKNEAPPSKYDCTDNVAWIEFGGVFRVYYVFRPWAYSEGLDGVLTTLGTSLADIDVFVCNDNCGMHDDAQANMVLSSFAESCTERDTKLAIRFESVWPLVEAQLIRDSGIRFGATNGVYTDDFHPCMPGPPDAEVDILFAAISNRVTAVA